MINYGKQTLEDDDISAVIEVFRSNTFLTTGPWVDKFEKKIAQYVNSEYAVAVNSGTAALHCACDAIGIGPDDEVIVPTIAFVASANCVLYCGGKPIFCEVNPDTLNIDPTKIKKLINKKTKAIIMVDMCGQPCDFNTIKTIADKHKLVIIQDSSHSLGSIYKGKKVGSYSDLTIFSFHPVKNITTAEGGMIVTNNKNWYTRMKSFRSHGIDKDSKTREIECKYKYNMNFLGYNYRLPDINCALGISQLNKLDKFINLRRKLYNKYINLFKKNSLLKYFPPLIEKKGNISAFHLFIIRVKKPLERDNLYNYMLNNNIRCNVHYLPIHLHPFYKNLGWKEGDLPISENIANSILTLPLYPSLNRYNIENIVDLLKKYLKDNIPM